MSPPCMKEALIPEFFTGSRTEGYVCAQCHKKIGLPKARKSYGNFGNLVSHLERKDHKDTLNRYEAAVEKLQAERKAAASSEASSSGRQQDIRDSFRKVGHDFRRGSAGDAELQKLTMEWLVEAGLPWRVVESPRLAQVLSLVSGGKASLRGRTFFRERLEPLYEETVAKVKEILRASEPFVGVTSDGWGSTMAKASLLSLTAHVIHKGRKRKLCLAAVPCEEAKTSGYLKSKLREMFEFWELNPASIVSITTDNELAMTKAVDELVEELGGEGGKILGVRCLQHTLELILKDGIAKQPIFNQLMVYVRGVCSFFSKSLDTCRRLGFSLLKKGHRD